MQAGWGGRVGRVFMSMVGGSEGRGVMSTKVCIVHLLGNALWPVVPRQFQSNFFLALSPNRTITHQYLVFNPLEP